MMPCSALPVWSPRARLASRPANGLKNLLWPLELSEHCTCALDLRKINVFATCDPQLLQTLVVREFPASPGAVTGLESFDLFSYQCESGLGDCAVLDGALVGGRESVAKGQKDELLRNDLEV